MNATINPRKVIVWASLACHPSQIDLKHGVNHSFSTKYSTPRTLINVPVPIPNLDIDNFELKDLDGH
ncbi:hypothetical protein L1887_30017 [Cichorium endivia]|nr:hypothetical protein L1887_30017 [Cichorium endivia]